MNNVLVLLGLVISVFIVGLTMSQGMFIAYMVFVCIFWLNRIRGQNEQKPKV